MAETLLPPHPALRAGGLSAFRKLRRKILSQRCDLDPFLSDLSARYPTHAFLGRSTQAVYQRQVALLVRLTEWILKKQPSAAEVLDWGCGKGHNSYLLKKAGFQVTSCDKRDSSDDSSFGQEVPILQEKDIRVIPLEQAVQLPFQDRAFDIVSSFGVLEHVERDLDSMVEIRRILRPGGIFFVTFLPYFLSWTQFVAHLRGDDYHDRLYSLGKLHHLADRAGFMVLDAWHGQLFPKNSIKYSPLLEKLDRLLTDFTPLRYFATNLEAVLVRPLGDGSHG
jgi:SAM-dependent methyltransferase